MKMRTFWAAAAAAVGSCVVSIAILGVPGAESGGGTLKVYNWGEYIDEDCYYPSLKMKPVFLLSMTFLKQTKKCILLWKQAALNMM